MSTPSHPEQPGAPTPDRRTISVEEAGRRLGVGRGLAYELARRGEIPALRLGRRLVVPEAALDLLLAADAGTARDDRTAA